MPGAGRHALGGIGFCSERLLLSWLMALSNTIPAAADLDAAGLIASVLPVLTAVDELEPIIKVAAVNLLRLSGAVAGRECVDAVLASMASDPPGPVRRQKVALLRHWLAAEGKSSQVVVAVVAACLATPSVRYSHHAVPEIIGESASWRSFSPVTIGDAHICGDCGHGHVKDGVVLDAAPQNVAVLT